MKQNPVANMMNMTFPSRYADFDRDPVDVAIRFGTGEGAGRRLRRSQSRVRQNRLQWRGAGGEVSSMKQLTCTGPSAIEWRDVPEPRLQGDGKALVRPLAVARCDLRPQEVTTRVVDWNQAPAAYGEPAIKLVVRRV